MPSNKVLNLSIIVASVLLLVLLLLAGYQVWVNLPGKEATGSNESVSQKAEPPKGSKASPADMSQPLKVVVDGKHYPIDFVDVREDWLTISTKEEPGKFADLQIKISMSNQKTGSFSNKKLSFSGKDFNDPYIQISVRADEKFSVKSEFINKGYNLKIEFGQEKDFRIPVKLSFVTDNKFTVSAEGNFLAKTSDLVIVNGKVDLNQDNTDTIRYAADQFVLGYFNDKKVTNIKHSSIGSSYPGTKDVHPNPGHVYSSAHLAFSFEVDGQVQDAEFKMVRTNAGWQVYRIVKPESMQSAVTPDLSLDALAMYDIFGEQVVYAKFDKGMVKKWESKGASLRYANPANKEQIQDGKADYLVELNDVGKRYLKIMVEKQGTWKIKQVLDGSQVPDAHVPKPAAGKVRGSEVQKYMAAQRIEKELNQKHKDLQVRNVSFSCGYSQLLTDCKISWWRLVNNEEKCEGTRYMYKRHDSKSDWQFVQELAADEKLDHRDGMVKKRDKPEKHHCW